MRQRMLKISIFIFSFILILIFCYSWVRYGVDPAKIMKYLVAEIGSSVGVSLTVPENPFNTWAKQLQERETELQKREQTLNEILIKTERESRIILTLILVLIIILFFLVLLNFYFDYRTRRFQKV